MLLSRPRGLTIGSILLVVTIVATLGFALSSVSVQHLGLMTRQSNSEQARNLAESAINLAIEKVLSSAEYEYGLDGQEPEPLMVSLDGTTPGSKAVLTFNPDEATSLGIPYSTNNIRGNSAIEGSGGATVPKESVRLVAVGESGGVTREIEAVLHVPSFPYALASSGPIKCLGGVTVASIRGDIELDDAGGLVESGDLFPAHLLSNAAEASPGVQLGAQTLVTGDVEAAGTLELASGAEVRGEKRPRVKPITFPQFELEDYDPGDNATQLQPNSGDDYVSAQGEEFRGAVRINGGLTVLEEGVTLNGALLYVDGNVEIRSGGLSGRGILVTTGDISITGNLRLEADSDVAVLSGGDLLLKGNGSQSSYIKGLFYSKGVVRAEQLTVIGAMIAGDEETDSLTLEDARLFDFAGADFFSISLNGTSPGNSGSSNGASGSGSVTIYGFGAALPQSLPNAAEPSTQNPNEALRLEIDLRGQEAEISLTFLATNHPDRTVPITRRITVPAVYVDMQTEPRPPDLRALPQFRELADLMRVHFTTQGSQTNNNYGTRLQLITHMAAQQIDQSASSDGEPSTDIEPDPQPEPTEQLITVEPSEFVDMLDRIQVVSWQVK